VKKNPQSSLKKIKMFLLYLLKIIGDVWVWKSESNAIIRDFFIFFDFWHIIFFLTSIERMFYAMIKNRKIKKIHPHIKKKANFSSPPQNEQNPIIKRCILLSWEA
jgi:hypothetical protein